jgi:hypothetical protein
LRKPIILVFGLSYIDNISQSAVVRGAALSGLEGIAPRVKHARRHYGIALDMEFRAGIDPESLSYHDHWDNTRRCKNRMQWIISKVSSSVLLSSVYARFN